MAMSLRQWESDPLFSAAEVVQDSADRMESIYRHLLHEQALVQVTLLCTTMHPSIEHTVHDLKTTLETNKWQLEDFERAVSLAAVTDKSDLRTDIISRHEQFVSAIREQILDVVEYVGNPLMKKTIENTNVVNLNEQENDRLALFLFGGSHSEIVPQSDLEESSILRRFLDRTSQCGFSGSSNEIIEHGPEEISKLSIDNFVPVVHDSFLVQGNGLRKVGSSLQVGNEVRVPLKNFASDYYGEDGGWDLDSCEEKSQRRKLKSDRNKRNMLCFFGSSLCANVNKIYRSLMKWLKDGEERHHSSSDTCIFHREQDQCRQGSSSWSGPFQVASHEIYTRSIRFCQRLCRISYQRSLHYSLASRHSVQLGLAIICTLLVLAFLVAIVA